VPDVNVVLGFVAGVVLGLSYVAWVGVGENTNARLLRKILAHLDPEDPEGRG
jgi:hypothetical protein